MAQTQEARRLAAAPQPARQPWTQAMEDARLRSLAERKGFTVRKLPKLVIDEDLPSDASTRAGDIVRRVTSPVVKVNVAVLLWRRLRGGRGWDARLRSRDWYDRSHGDNL